MKKFLFTMLLVAAVASAFNFVLAQDDDGEKKFVIHGEIRQRADYLNNFADFNDKNSDSALFYPYRARIAAEGHFSKDVMGYAEFQMFGVWGDTVPNRAGNPFPTIYGLSSANGNFTINPVDQNIGNDIFGSNSVGLYQAWIGLNNIGGTHFSLKVGRQEIVKGSEMLLGDLDFYSGISHDGAVGCWDYDNFDLDVWMTRPYQHMFGTQPNTFFYQPYDHQSINFYGAWVDLKKIPRKIGVSAYLMYLENGVLSASTDRRAFYTLGGRANHDAEAGQSGFAWSAEIAAQSGDFNPGTTANVTDKGDISAHAFEGMFGYSLHVGQNDHMFQAKYAMASGNKTDINGNPEEPNKAKAFDPMFQDYHMRYGLSDIFTLSDLTAASFGWSMHQKDHYFGVDLWDYRLTEDIYDANGDKQKNLGRELDGWWKYQYNPNTQVMAGLAYFKPGDVIKYINDPAGGPTDAGLRLVGNLRLRF